MSFVYLLKKVSLCLFTLQIFVASEVIAKGAAAPAVADEVIDAFIFDDACDAGPWTKRALGVSQTLSSIYTSLQKKTNCSDSGLSPSIAAATSLSQTLMQLESIDAARNEKVSMETMSDLLTSLKDPTLSADTSAALLAEYTEQRVSLAKTRGILAADSTLNDTQIYYGLEALSTHLNTLLSQRAALNACFTANPLEAVKIATNLADLAGNFVPLISGASIKAGAAITRYALDTFQNAPISAEIRRTQNTRLTLGLRCGMQTMLRQYCGARDANVLSGYINRDAAGREPSEFFYGLDLIDNRFPILDSWLDRVSNGVKPRTDEAAGKINEYFELVNLASSNRRRMDGLYSELLDDLSKIESEAGKRDRIQEHFRILIARVWGGEIFTGQREGFGVFSGRKNAVELVSLIFNIEIPPQIDFSSFLSAQIRNMNVSDLNDVAVRNRRSYEIFEVRETDIKRDFKEHVNVDSPTLVRSATSSQLTKNSPIQVLNRMNKFFNLFTFDANPVFEEQDRELIRTIRVALDELSHSLGSANATTEENSNAIIAKTFDAFRLADQNVFLNGRIRQLISTDLQARVDKGEIPQKLVDIAWMANQDLMNVFTQTKQKPDKMQIQFDTNEAQRILGESLDSFTSFFENAIENSMQRLHRQAEANGEMTYAQMKAAYARDPHVSFEEPNRISLAQLCIVSLSASDDVDSRFCKGAFIVSQDAKLMLDYDQLEAKLKRRPFKERVCVYDDFVKKDRIAHSSIGILDSRPLSDLSFDNLRGGPLHSRSAVAQPIQISPERRERFQSWVDETYSQ